jgi:hypothetical protein
MKRFVIAATVLATAFSAVFAAEKTGFTDLKSKIAIGCSVTGSGASVRLWPTDNLGMEFSVGLSADTNLNSISVPLSAQMLFPILEKGNFAVNVAPGIGFAYTQSSASTNGFKFSAGVDVMLEMALPLISENLSIGSGIGAWFAVSSSSTRGTTTTGFNVNLITVNPVMVRYYF